MHFGIAIANALKERKPENVSETHKNKYSTCHLDVLFAVIKIRFLISKNVDKKFGCYHGNLSVTPAASNINPEYDYIIQA